MHKIVRRILIFSLLICANTLFAQIQVTIPDTSLARGINNKIKIPVKGKLATNQIDSLRIILSYQSQIIDINSAIGSDNFVIKDQSPQLNKYYPRLDSAIAVVSSSNIQLLDSGTICQLLVEGLAGPDSIAYIKVESIFINGILQSGLIQDSAIIKVLAIPVFPIPTEGIGYNSPNPFLDYTRLHFYLTHSSSVRFTIYTSNGDLTADSWSDQSALSFSYFNKDGSPYQPKSSLIFGAGEYILQLTPYPWNLASGPYYVFMITDTGIYRMNLQFLK